MKRSTTAQKKGKSLKWEKKLFKCSDKDFPSGSIVGKKKKYIYIYMPISAEKHGFNPWSGRIPHALEQLSLCTTATEAQMP